METCSYSFNKKESSRHFYCFAFMFIEKMKHYYHFYLVAIFLSHFANASPHLQSESSKVVIILQNSTQNNETAETGKLFVETDTFLEVFTQLCTSNPTNKVGEACNIQILCENGQVSIYKGNQTMAVNCVSISNQIQKYFHMSEMQSQGLRLKGGEKEGENLIDSSGESSVVAKVSTQFYCANNMTNGKLPYNSCSLQESCRKFVECIKRVPYVRLCPTGQVFNILGKMCKDKVNVTSGESNYGLLGVNKQRRSKRGAVVGKEESCSPSSDYYIQPHSSHCNKFEICSNGKKKEQSCGEGALFNPLSLVCDFPHNVDCKSRRIDFSTYDCQVDDKYTASHPDNCEQFIECDKGSLHIKSCPPATAFHFEDGECNYAYKAKCKKPISLEHDSSVNYIPHRATRSAPRNPLNLDCSFNYIAPHPTFCNKFVECEQKRIFIKDCGPGTAYNPMLGQCDWPYNVRRMIPEDCSRYLQCGRSGRYIERSCGRGQVYNGERGQCILSSGVDYDMNCGRQEIITPPPS